MGTHFGPGGVGLYGLPWSELNMRTQDAKSKPSAEQFRNAPNDTEYQKMLSDQRKLRPLQNERIDELAYVVNKLQE